MSLSIKIILCCALTLIEFEQNRSKEFIGVESLDSLTYLRYISPLYVEQSCLSCHKEQGYKIGDLRGAISIRIPIEKNLKGKSLDRVLQYVKVSSICIKGLSVVEILRTVLRVLAYISPYH